MSLNFSNATTDDSKIDTTETTRGGLGELATQTDNTELTITVICLIIGTVGIFSNFMVIVIIGTNNQMRKTNTNIYILNQSVADLAVAVFLLLQRVAKNMDGSYLTVADDLYCRIWGPDVPFWATFAASTYNLVMINLERLAAIVYPIWHRNSLKQNHIYASLVITWVLGILIPSYPIAVSGVVDGVCHLYTFWPSPITQTVIVLLMTTGFAFLLPIIIHIYCYSRMAWVLLTNRDSNKTNTNNSDQQSEVQQRKDQNKQRIKKNVFVTMALVTLCFFFCWILNQSFWIGFNVGLIPATMLFTPFHWATMILVFLNCCVNPFVYLARYEQFQRACKAFFKKRQIRVDNNSSSLLAS